VAEVVIQGVLLVKREEDIDSDTVCVYAWSPYKIQSFIKVKTALAIQGQHASAAPAAVNTPHVLHSIEVMCTASNDLSLELQITGAVRICWCLQVVFRP